VLSLAGGLRQPVGSFFWWPKTKDCVAHSVEPPVLLLNYQENQETWPRAWGDLAAAVHLRRLPVIWLQKTARTAKARGAGFVAVAWLHKGSFARVGVLTDRNSGGPPSSTGAPRSPPSTVPTTKSTNIILWEAFQTSPFTIPLQPQS
jgi:hypothetical protein